MVSVVKVRDVVIGNTGSRNPTKAPEEIFIYVDVAAVDNSAKAIVGARSIVGAEAPSRARKLIHSGDILVSTVRPNLNAVALVPAELHGQIASTGFCVLRTKEQILPEYLFYFTRTKTFVDCLALLVAGAMYPAVSDSQVLDQKLPLPSISEQRRIVDLLSRAECIVRLRREAEKKAAELIPALFLEMFGDPATNPKGWPVARLGDLADKMSDGPFGSNLKSSHYVESGVRVLRLQNISVGRLIDDVKAFVSHEHFASLPRHRCLPGDVIIGTLGEPNLRAFVMPPTIPEALNKADCVQFRCRHDVAIPAFICWLMNMPSTLTMAASLVQGITLTRISMGRLRELVVPVPPLVLQRDFAKSVEAADSIQFQQSAAAKAQAAFDALLAGVFNDRRGE
jgi:type I restriction enzyme, S subunit